MLQRSNGEIWKSTIKKYNVGKSINATATIEENIDFVRWVEDELAGKANLYEPIPAYMIPMGMTIGDVAGGRNVLVNSGISVESLNPQMKLIASGTTTEEVANIIINKTWDELEATNRAIRVTNRIVVFMIVPVATASNYVVLSVNGTGITSAYRGLDTSSQKCVRLEASHCGGGLWAGFSIASSGGTAWDGGGSRSVDMRYPQGEVVTEIKLTSSGTTFPVGTQYQVYGIEV